LPTDADSADDPHAAVFTHKDYTFRRVAQSARRATPQSPRPHRAVLARTETSETQKKCGATRDKRQKPAFFLAGFIADRRRFG
jgi:hypothetical protein